MVNRFMQNYSVAVGTKNWQKRDRYMVLSGWRKQHLILSLEGSGKSCDILLDVYTRFRKDG